MKRLSKIALTGFVVIAAAAVFYVWSEAHTAAMPPRFRDSGNTTEGGSQQKLPVPVSRQHSIAMVAEHHAHDAEFARLDGVAADSDLVAADQGSGVHDALDEHRSDDGGSNGEVREETNAFGDHLASDFDLDFSGEEEFDEMDHVHVKHVAALGRLESLRVQLQQAKALAAGNAHSFSPSGKIEGLKIDVPAGLTAFKNKVKHLEALIREQELALHESSLDEDEVSGEEDIYELDNEHHVNEVALKRLKSLRLQLRAAKASAEMQMFPPELKAFGLEFSAPLGLRVTKNLIRNLEIQIRKQELALRERGLDVDEDDLDIDEDLDDDERNHDGDAEDPELRELREQWQRAVREAQRAAKLGKVDEANALRRKMKHLKMLMAVRNRVSTGDGIVEFEIGFKDFKDDDTDLPEGFQEHAERIEHMREAAENLRHAGMDEMAEELTERAEQMMREMREQIEKRHQAERREHHERRREGPLHEIHELLRDLREEVRALRGEVHELRKHLESEEEHGEKSEDEEETPAEADSQDDELGQLETLDAPEFDGARY